MPIRLIPAHAGKTGHGPMTGATHPAHPRSRGENQIDSSAGNKLPGSSPLTRGKLLLDPEEVPIEGLIPAHAGKTRPPACQGPEWAAHPRSRGENRQERSRLSCVDGSSPLTRGKPADCRVPLDTQRLIPAHAGKTRSPPGPQPWRPAHPRSRGENRVGNTLPPASTGSSPLTRGKPGGEHPATGVHRLIPAHAGKTWVTSAASPTGRAHPRSRGENWSDRLYTSDTWGSSPLTRGKLSCALTAQSSSRLIPAHAGKTKACSAGAGLSAAHPRSRGENRSLLTPLISPSGSSPLTRGKLVDLDRQRGWLRLIPAHAGKTP